MVFERQLSDYHFQALVWKCDAAQMRTAVLQADASCKQLIESLDDAAVVRLFYDVGGHDHAAILAAFEHSRRKKSTPSLIIAHTIKGRGLRCVAANGNHSALPADDEVAAILAAEGLTLERPFQRLPENLDAARYASQRGQIVRLCIEALEAQSQANRTRVEQSIAEQGGVPAALDINLKLSPVTHTQWMWGQLAAKLVRIGVFDELQRAGRAHKAGRAPTPEESRWSPIADLMMTMAPDVGTSTNMNPAMDEKIFGPRHEQNWESKLELSERLRPELAPTDEAWTRHIRFEIAEANCMSAVGSFGKMGRITGIPFLPMMTVYDFFIKRALDQRTTISTGTVRSFWWARRAG